MNLGLACKGVGLRVVGGPLKDDPMKRASCCSELASRDFSDGSGIGLRDSKRLSATQTLNPKIWGGGRGWWRRLILRGKEYSMSGFMA